MDRLGPPLQNPSQVEGSLNGSSLSYLGFALVVTEFGGTLSIIQTEAVNSQGSTGSLRWFLSRSPRSYDAATCNLFTVWQQRELPVLSRPPTLISKSKEKSVLRSGATRVLAMTFRGALRHLVLGARATGCAWDPPTGSRRMGVAGASESHLPRSCHRYSLGNSRPRRICTQLNSWRI